MGGKQVETRLKNSRDSWKNKTRIKSLELKRQQKRILELEESRDKWKANYQRLKKSGTLSIRQGEKIARHSYDSGVIWLCVWLQMIGKLSFRGGRHVIVGLGLYLGVSMKVPSASSIRLWVCKYGYYRYTCPKDKTSSWILIADESVVIGQERLLLLLGVKESSWNFDRYLSSSDVEVLGLSIASSWKSEAISKQIDQIREQYHISYVVSDQGNNLQATWKQQGLLCITDCTHLWAKSLEKSYKQELDYQAFCKAVTDLRKRWILSKNSFLLPPPLRAKSRFHQLFQYVDWVAKIKQNWHKLNPEQHTDLTLIHTHHQLLSELAVLQKVVSQLNQIIKIKGLNKDSIHQAINIINQELVNQTRLLTFKTLIENYLITHLNRIEDKRSYLCCSDVIESIFGTYKQSIAQGNQNITELVLAIASLGKKIDTQLIKQAMEAVKTQDIVQWKKKNTTPSLAKIKTDFFTKNGEKKK